MSVRVSLLRALGLCAAYLLAPGMSEGLAESRTTKPSPEIARMDKLSYAINVSVAHAILLGDTRPKNEAEIAKLLGISPFAVDYAQKVRAAAQRMENSDYRKKVPAWMRDVFPVGGVQGSRQVELDVAVMAVEMLRAAVKDNRLLVNRYCAKRPDEDLCAVVDVYVDQPKGP